VHDNANTRTKSGYRRTANVHNLVEEDMECETNTHEADDCDDQDADLSEILEANVNDHWANGKSHWNQNKEH